MTSKDKKNILTKIIAQSMKISSKIGTKKLENDYILMTFFFKSIKIWREIGKTIGQMIVIILKML